MSRQAYTNSMIAIDNYEFAFAAKTYYNIFIRCLILAVSIEIKEKLIEQRSRLKRMKEGSKMKSKRRITVRRSLIISLLIVIFILSVTGCTSTNAPSGLESIYEIAQQKVPEGLISPASAKFPEFDKSFVTYDTSILKDFGKGVLEYRVYDVKSYVDSQNVYGAIMRNNFWVKVYYYVDDYNSPQFGEKGIHKGVKDHYYAELKSVG
jgi:hypothetical protein